MLPLLRRQHEDGASYEECGSKAAARLRQAGKSAALQNSPPCRFRRAAESSAMMTRVEIWLKGLLAAAISGAAGGVLTGLAAVGIDPQHFNLQSGIGATFRIGAAAALINSVIGVAAYLQKSPLPSGD